MIKKLALILTIAALATLAAFAGTVPSVGHYTVTLSQPSTIQGTVLKPGDYRLSVTATKVSIATDNGKQLMEVPVTIETQEKKFDSTVVLLDTSTGKAVVSAIRLGGTKTKLVFNN